MRNFFNLLWGKVITLFNKDTADKITPNIQVSANMATAINNWFKAFYATQGIDAKPNEHKTRIVTVLTNYIATLATNEIMISAGTGARAEYITDQLSRFIAPSMRLNVQMAGVGGELILKPFVCGKNIITEAITADRFYPTRINGAGVVEAGFFTDFDKLNGKDVVRIENFDLQSDGVYINNKAYYQNTDGIGAEIALTSVCRWRDIVPDLLVSNVDRPLFATLKMPFANTVDNTSRLPVSIYANSLDAINELDRIYSDFIWEIHTGKRKKIIDSTAIKPKNGERLMPQQDMSTDEYIVLDLIGADTHTIKPFDDYTPNMRIESYQKAIDIQLRLIEMQCGFSAGTFTFDVKAGKMTATQIISEDKDTYNTIKAIQDSGLLQGLKDLIYVYDVYATLYNLAPSGTIEPSITFGDSIFEDTTVEFSRRKQMADAGYIKPEKLVGWYFGISDDEAQKDYMPEPTQDDEIFGGE